jgi:hypothetical protein
MVTLGAIRYLFLRGERLAPLREIVIPLAGVVVVVYVLYRSVFPIPSGAAEYFPIVAGAWIVIGIVAVLVNPKLASTIGGRLSQDEGLVADPTSDTVA